MQKDGRLSWNSCKTEMSVKNASTSPTANNVDSTANTSSNANYECEKSYNTGKKAEHTDNKNELKEKPDDDGKVSEIINLSITSMTSIDT